jgi:hypothetical protein
LPAGTYTYYAQATDNGGAISAAGTAAPKTTHTLQAPASIAGTVFRDADGDGVRDAGEAALAGVKVYFDGNANNRFDSGERSVLTDAAGRYAFAPLTSGTYAVRFITPAGLVRTVPASGRHVVQLGAGRAVTGKDFGAAPAASISGRVYNDLDGDRVRDANEPAAAGWSVFLDANNNARLDAGETSMLTDKSGAYSFGGLRPGRHIVRAVLQGAWQYTGYVNYAITLAVGQKRTGVDFAVRRTV